MTQQLYLYEQIEETFKYHILKLFIKICMSNLRTAFNIFKINHAIKKQNQLVLNRRCGNKSIAVVQAITKIARILKPISLARKRILFSLAQRTQQNQGYWKAKSCLLMKQTLQKLTNQENSLYFQMIRIRAVQKDSKKLISCMESALNIPINRIFRTSFNSLLYFINCREITDKNIMKKHKPKANKDIATVSLFRGIRYIVKRLLWLPFLSICEGGSQQMKISRLEDKYSLQSEQFEETDDEQEIQISQIKSILETINRENKKQSANTFQKSIPSRGLGQSRDYQPLNRALQMLCQKQHYFISDSFGVLRWRILEIYDAEMIQKLETEINVLQHQFDSL